MPLHHLRDLLRPSSLWGAEQEHKATGMGSYLEVQGYLEPHFVTTQMHLQVCIWQGSEIRLGLPQI